jgi:predicted dehydrogenase
MAGEVRAVLAGCGNISRTWLTAIGGLPEVAIVGLVDIDEGTARARAAEFGIEGAAIGTDLGAILDTVRPDAVFDCTIPAAHPEVTLTAFGRGCHVLGEKPIAPTLDEARRMVAAAEGAGKLYAVIQNRRYDRNIRRLRAFLGSGAIGPITTVTSAFYIAAHFGGFRDHMPHVLLVDMAIHTFDAARLLTGADPLAVYCREWNPAGSWYDRDASAVAIFELGGGITYTYHGSWCAEGVNTTWEADWRIVGTRGSVTWDGAEGFRAEVAEGRAGIRSTYRELPVPPYDDPDLAPGHAGVIRDFARAVRGGPVPETVAADNIKSLAMVFGAVASAEQGRRVEIAW